jgi:hypothetical protein
VPQREPERQRLVGRGPRRQATPLNHGDEPLARRWRAALTYCGRREHLRRTIPIALVVGVVLTAINQLDVILGGDATAGTWVKCGLNFAVPFIVSNLGLLSGRTPRG